MMINLKSESLNLKSIIIFFVIIIVSFLNFQFNLFNVISNERFEYFQVESEQFVTDGYLNHEINKEVFNRKNRKSY